MTRHSMFASAAVFVAAVSVSVVSASAQPAQGAPAAAPAAPAAQKESIPEARKADVSSIDAILAALYDSISGPAGQPRDWNRFRSLFVAGARLIPTGRTPEGQARITVTDPDGYIARSSAALAQGFFEKEIARKVDQFGSVAHVFSTYESRRKADDTTLLARGINSIQLYFDGTRWSVVSIYWQAERPDAPIPAAYLPAPR
jgi:hypothetical protein